MGCAKSSGQGCGDRIFATTRQPASRGHYCLRSFLGAMNIAVAGPPVAPGVNAETPRATTIAIVAMGGEGGGVLADWIVDLAEHSGYLAQTTSVPGVAQRTGSTVYYIEIFPKGPAVAANKAPILALMPVPGELDIVLASELMEAGRAIQRGRVPPDRTSLIASTHRGYSMTHII